MSWKLNKHASLFFLGFAIPDSEMTAILREDKFPSIQTHNFVWKLLNSLRKYFADESLYIVSSRQISDYPLNPNIIIRGRTWNEGISIREIFFVNLPYLRLLSRFFSAFLAGIRWLLSTSYKGSRVIIVYSVHFPFMLSGLAISKLARVPIIGVWTDPPAEKFPHDSILKGKLRFIENIVARFIMARMTGCIALTRQLAEDYAPCRPALIIEAITEPLQCDRILEKYSPFTVVYAGSLSKKNGIDALLEAFSLLKQEDIELLLAGKGELEAKIRECQRIDRRIRYLGFLPNRQVIKIECCAHILINPRPGNQSFTRYSFPSKLIEYMATGTPVISTRLMGIPVEYYNHMIVIENATPQEIASAIEYAYAMPREALAKLGENARSFAEAKNTTMQGSKIAQFIKEIISIKDQRC